MLSRRLRLLTLAVPVTASLALAGPALATGETKGDKAILKAGVITKLDVPADWTSKKGDPSGQALKGIKECKKVNRVVSEANNSVPRARSSEFSDAAQPNQSQAENTVYAFSGKKAAGKFLSVFDGPAATSCFEGLGVELARNQPSIDSPTVTPITDLQGVGDEALGYEIVNPYTQAGGTASLYVDFVFVRAGRSVIAFVFGNVDARIQQGPEIVNSVVQRVNAAEA
jgi:hypothetical protein